jgi:thiosulfate/3-mercaptopyruvate sulfurtransferase
MTDRARWFVTPDWLRSRLDDQGVVIVDGSWHLAGRDARKEYDAEHIPGAVFFDIDTVADRSNPLPHMLPSPDVFAAAVGALGIDEKQKLVVYDSVGLSSAPRVWWTFRVMGARDVVILEGGLPGWKAKGHPVDAKPVRHPPKTFRAHFDPRSVVDMGQVREGLASRAFQLVDARPAARFLGAAPEPRNWVKTGRVPGSFNVPSGELIVDGKLKDAETIRKLFAAAGVDLSRPIATSCGSGVNAAALSLALDTIGIGSTLYDGSWTEWGATEGMPVATGTDS